MAKQNPDCEYYPNREQSCCLRPIVARVMTLERGLLWLCDPHLKAQDERDKELRAAKTCSFCGKIKEDVSEVVDPYVFDVFNEEEIDLFCEDCLDERAANI